MSGRADTGSAAVSRPAKRPRAEASSERIGADARNLIIRWGFKTKSPYVHAVWGSAGRRAFVLRFRQEIFRRQRIDQRQRDQESGPRGHWNPGNLSNKYTTSTTPVTFRDFRFPLLQKSALSQLHSPYCLVIHRRMGTIITRPLLIIQRCSCQE